MNEVRVIREGQRNIRDLDDGRGFTRPLIDRRTGSQHLDVQVIVLIPGRPPGRYHIHTSSENAYFVLDGMVRVETSAGHQDLKPGDAIFIPPSVPHSASNPGTTEARILQIYVPAPADFVEVPRPQR